MARTAGSSRRWALVEGIQPESFEPEAILEALLLRRGLETPEEQQHFLEPRLSRLADPLRLPDMREAVLRVERALRDRETILLYSDYDVDGMTSCAVLYRLLSRLGGQVRAFQPERLSEGYGVSFSGIERAVSRGPEPGLFIALDCGTTSVAEMRSLAERGIDAIIIDHHELAEELPPCCALVNPQRGKTDRYLATVGLAFKFSHALLKLRGDPKLFDLKEVLDLVALGTVADLVPLEGDNRILVHQGLKRMTTTSHVGLRELMQTAGLRRAPTPSTLGFVLGPRLNASGRVAEAALGFELLITGDRERAQALARELEGFNRQRQELEQRAVEEAEEMLAKVFDPETDRCIVVGSPRWHQGVVGIVASRLAKMFYRPAVVIAIDASGHGKGSARGIEGFSLMDGLRGCARHLKKFGGHAVASGLEIDADKIDEFRRDLNLWLAEHSPESAYRETLRVDVRLPASALTEGLALGLARLEPFGQKNPAPLLWVEGLHFVNGPKAFGRNHVKMVLGNDQTEFDAVAFGFGTRAVPKAPFDVVGFWEWDQFIDRPGLRLVDWREPLELGERSHRIG
ncbi:MAG: single-stranded-DNA-specific exonuclease RecJ [Verrucomicrobiia bacterium]